MNLATVTQAISVPQDPRVEKQLKSLKKACEQFEAVFAKQLLTEMRKGVKETEIGDQAGSEIYKDMMDQSIADSISHQGALGIAKMLYKQFEKQVSGKSSEGAPVSSSLGLQPSNNQVAAGRSLDLQVRESEPNKQENKASKQAISDLEVQATTGKPPLTGPISFGGRKLPQSNR